MKKDHKYFFKRCRLCGRCFEGSIDIFSVNEKNLPELIHHCLSIKVREDDALPKKLCQFCDKKLTLWEKFKNSCENVQVKLIADSLPNMIEVSKSKKNGKPKDTVEPVAGCSEASSAENGPKTSTECKRENKAGGNHSWNASESTQQCTESVIDMLGPNLKQEVDIKSRNFTINGPKWKGNSIYNQSVGGQQKGSSESATIAAKDQDIRNKVLEITDQEISDLNDTISMNLHSDKNLQKMAVKEINNNVDSSHTKTQNNLLIKNLRRIQQKELKRKNKKRSLKEYTCRICKKVFHSQRKMKAHFKSHSNEVETKRRRKSPESIYQCPHCPQKLTTSFNLRHHLETHSEMCNYCCHVCGKLFRTHSSLLNHLRVHVCDDMKESGKDSTVLANGHSVKLFQCQVCDKKFRQSGHLAYHLKTHTGLRRFTCGKCGMLFTEKYQLRKHVNAVHDKVKRHTCDVCGKQFLHTHNYRDHILQHEGIARVSCDICGKEFVTSNALNRHRRLHTGEKPFLCNICGKAFRDCSNRKRHQDKHIKEAEEALATKMPFEEQSTGPLCMIVTAEVSNRKADVMTAGEFKNDKDGKSDETKTASPDKKSSKEQEEDRTKKTYLNLKTYFESNDVVSLKDEDDGEGMDSPLNSVQSNGNHNVSLLQPVHASGKFDDASNAGPLFGSGLFGEELDLNPESLLLIGDGRINNGLLEGTENDGETIKDQLVWVPSANCIQGDVALSGIHSGDIVLNGIQSGDVALNGIQGDIGFNSIQSGDITGILEVGMGLCSDFDVNSAIELDSGKDALTDDFPSINEIKAAEDNDKTLDNVLCLQVF